MKKAVSPLISHSIYLAIGVVVLIFISSTVWYLYDVSIKQTIRTELTQISQKIENEITTLYNTFKDSQRKPEINRTILLGESKIYLPEKVAGRKYLIELKKQADIIIKGISEENITYSNPQIITKSFSPEIQINHNLPIIRAGLQGYSYGEIQPTKLKYYRFDINNTIRDVIILGEIDLLIISD